jgi:predicted ATPase
MLKSYWNGEREFDFVAPDKDIHSAKNTYTIIVGRNGTGKSRLLRSVVTSLIGEVVDRNSLARDERINSASDFGGLLNMNWRPSQIICASTSPFDKFPLLRRDHLARGYSYLGLRGLPSSNLGLAYMGRIIFSLIEAADQSRLQARAIAGVLEYLGYVGGIHARLQIPANRLVEELLTTSDPRRVLEDASRRVIFSGDGLGPLRALFAEDVEAFWRAIEAAKRLSSVSFSSRVIDTLIDEHGVQFHCNPGLDRVDLMLLARAGLLRMREVILNKKSVDRPIRLHEASSGEQAVVMGLLGIGSHIKNNTLVCIDEPEVCLHPEWQERYIELLFHSFRRYRGCHFLIATHSPQIVAQIPEGNCFVMSMEDGQAREAQDYSRRSVDFQLAEVFNAPGFRNEYLSRVALNLFAKASKEKHFDQKSLHELVILRKAFAGLRETDPLRDLIIALEKMVKAYE